MGFHDFSLTPDQDQNNDFSQNVLRFAWLEITQHCNLRCTHCYTSSSPARKHGPIDWIPIIRQIRDTGCRRIQFIGGEPLTHPRIREYVRFAHDLAFEFVEVYTNAVLLNEDVVRFFRDHGTNVATSFYSTRAHSHDAVTLTKGSFDQTLTGIRNAVAGGIDLRVGIIGTADDPETFEVKAAFLEALGVDGRMIGYDTIRPVGRGAKLTAFSSRFETLCGACWDGKLAVSYDGQCYPCIMSRDVVVGDIRESAIRDIIAARALNQFRASYGAEVLHSRAESASAVNTVAAGMTDDPCSPDCTPSGPCTPMGCRPSADCNPYHCNPIEGCSPATPNCGPNDGTCSPSWICRPIGGSS